MDSTETRGGKRSISSAGRVALPALLVAGTVALGGCLIEDGRYGPGYGGGGYDRPPYGGGYGQPNRDRPSSGGGYGRPGAVRDTQILTCESMQGRLRRCAAGGLIRGVEIDRVLSGTRCVHRDNWGWDERDVWVDAGCRARFRVAIARGGRPGGGYDHTARRERVLDCASKDGRSRTCSVGFPIADARIVKRHSGSPCERGRSWGWRGRDIWVDQGCRARFRVYGR